MLGGRGGCRADGALDLCCVWWLVRELKTTARSVEAAKSGSQMCQVRLKTIVEATNGLSTGRSSEMKARQRRWLGVEE